MSFKINKLGSRIIKAKRANEAEHIVTITVILVILCVFTYPMYFYEPNFVFWIFISVKLILVAVLAFDLRSLVRNLISSKGA